MCDWKIVLTNGKEYIILSEAKSVKDLIPELYDMNKAQDIKMSCWKLSDNDKNNCGNVVINSATISSIEFNPK